MIELLYIQGSTKWYKEQTAKLNQVRLEVFAIKGCMNTISLSNSLDRMVKIIAKASLSAKQLCDTMRILFGHYPDILNERKTRMNLVRQKAKNQAHFLLNKASRYAIRKQREYVNITLFGKRPKGKGIT